MELSLTFRHVAPTDALKRRVEHHLARWERHFPEPVEVRVVLTVDSRAEQRCDVLALVEGEEIAAEASFPDLYVSIDAAFGRAAAQLRRLSGRRLEGARRRGSGHPAEPTTSIPPRRRARAPATA